MLSPEAILYYKNKPVEFAKDIIGVVPDEIQGDVLNSVAKNQLTSVRSGHGIGKSALQSWLILWFMCTRPFPKIPCTAPTKHQLHDILWAEVAKWLNPILRTEIEWTQEKLYMKSHPENWFAVPRTATQPDALQGFHAEHLLYIIDEASGVKDQVFEPVLGSLSTTDAKLIMCGNPTQLSGFFFDSHNKNRSIYNTFKVSGENSKRVAKEYIQMIVDMYGLESDVYRVRVAGEFPKAMPDSFIQLEWVENCSSKKVTSSYPQNRIDIGVDVARYGDDETVINTMFDKTYQQPFNILHHNDTMQTTGRVVQLVENLKSKYIGIPIHVKIDCDGLGVGVFDRLKEIKQQKDWMNVQLYECHFGASGGKNKQEEPIEFSNSTGLMWGLLREKLRRNEIQLVYDDRQIAQISNRRYRINSDGKIELERKEEMKKRGLTSPDRRRCVSSFFVRTKTRWLIDIEIRGVRMDINKIKKIITYDGERRKQIAIEKKYYENDNIIKARGILPYKADPMRNADNRVSHNFHQLITDEKTAYMFTNPVLFDVEDKKINENISKVLGDDFKSESAYLCTNATNNKVAWLHYWIEDNNFLYSAVETEQCIPIFDGKLKNKLIGFYRYYGIIDDEKEYVVFEIWDNKHCEKYKFKGNLDGTGLKYLPDEYEDFEHELGEVPFIEFRNNRNMISDLKKYKDLIDIYDKVMSGYANDLEDIQQLIYILENYGGENLKEFLGDLKRFKTVKTETGADGRTSGGLKTLQIEIPVEARNSILEILKKQIYESGQALQQDNEDFGNASGVALKFFYRKLELKAGLTQIEFEKGFAKFIRAIMRYLNVPDWETKTITQTWTRNMISNDLENAQIASESKDIISDETIIKNHPWVENPEAELQKIKEQKEENIKRQQEIFANAGGFENEETDEE